MIFCTRARPRPGAVALRREERLEDTVAQSGRHAGTVVLTAMRDTLARQIDLRLDGDARRMPAAGARLDGVSQQVAERLPQQHIVAFDDAELAARPRRHRRARGHPAESRRRRARRSRARSTSVSVSCAGRAKFRKLVTTWESDSVSSRMPSTYGRYGRRQRVRDRTACCSRESSRGRCGTRARCRPSARRPSRGFPSAAAALRGP